MRLPLPAEIANTRGNDEGVVARPSNQRIAQSREALSSVAQAVEAAGAGVQSLSPLNVVLSHADHQGFLNIRFHSFNLYPVGDDGSVGDPFAEGTPVHFISMVNQPVAVQTESILNALSTLVARQVMISKVQSGSADISEIDRLAAETDEVAHNQIVDVLRHGWKAAADMVARQAVAAGFILRVKYQPIPVSTLQGVAGRMPALRRGYNTIPIAREAVDRFASSIASRGYITAAPEVPEAIRAFTQQELGLNSIRQYIAEALRDALVTGNGYFAFATQAPFAIYNLRPDTAIEVGDGMVAPKDGETPVHALHLRGFDQPGSKYGLGILELAMSHLQQLGVFGAATALAKTALADPSLAEHRQWAIRTLDLAERVESDGNEKLNELFSPMLTLLPEPVPNLYFESREQM